MLRSSLWRVFYRKAKKDKNNTQAYHINIIFLIITNINILFG